MIKIKTLTAIFVCLLAGHYLFAQSAGPNLNIVFIGNSITYGATLDSPKTQASSVMAAAWLRKQPGMGTIAYSNQGHSGYTTVDFQPATRTFAQAVQAAGDFADKQARLVFSVMLGTNDSAITGPNGAPVAPANYQQNLKTIVDSLLRKFPRCIVILHHPIWYSPNTYNGAKYLQEGLSRMQSYFPEIDQLVAGYATTYPHRVFTGDTKAFAYFKKHHLTDLTPENGHQGIFYLHPNKAGAVILGAFWGKAIEKVVKHRLG